MDYMTNRQAAEKWGLSPRRVQVLCSTGRIPGATRKGSYWAIPANAEKPGDLRVKSGKYIGFSQKFRKRKDEPAVEAAGREAKE